jgi:tetratricopeptide (TPR) repeat protein
MYVSPTYRLRLYRDFKAIDPKDPYSVIRYYEQYEEALNTLDLDEYLDCTLGYTDALFEADEYGRHIVMCDHLIELVMRESMTYFGGEDIFAKLLFRKGVTYYNLNDHENALRVFKSVAKIAPNNPQTSILLYSCLRQKTPPKRLKFRAWGLLCFLLSAVSAGTGGLVIQPFYPDWMNISTIITIVLFVLGGFIYLYGELDHYLWCKKTVRKWTVLT